MEVYTGNDDDFFYVRNKALLWLSVIFLNISQLLYHRTRQPHYAFVTNTSENDFIIQIIQIKSIFLTASSLETLGCTNLYRMLENLDEKAWK